MPDLQNLQFVMPSLLLVIRTCTYVHNEMIVKINKQVSILIK